MSFTFDPRGRFVLVQAIVVGSKRVLQARLALDTGATITQLAPWVLEEVGSPPPVARTFPVATAGGMVFVAETRVARVQALGVTLANFRVLSHALPPATKLDGLLGLDFLRERLLQTDFRRGRVRLRRPWRWPWSARRDSAQ